MVRDICKIDSLDDGHNKADSVRLEIYSKILTGPNQVDLISLLGSDKLISDLISHVTQHSSRILIWITSSDPDDETRST